MVLHATLSPRARETDTVFYLYKGIFLGNHYGNIYLSLFSVHFLFLCLLRLY